VGLLRHHAPAQDVPALALPTRVGPVIIAEPDRLQDPRFGVELGALGLDVALEAEDAGLADEVQLTFG
jgi:hypothetical protein